VKVLVTGADGFVGRHLVRRLLRDGHEVGAACRPGNPAVVWPAPVTTISLELTRTDSVRAALEYGPDAVVHLAAVASNREAIEDPGRAWEVNAAGTARLADAMAVSPPASGGDPLLLVVSSGEVYGDGPTRPRRETDQLQPQSPYAASKVGAEVAALETRRRAGLRVVIARPFTHTGPGQPASFVIPAFVRRLAAARASGAPEVPSGNLDPVRDLLDVRDVVDAYVALLSRGEPGEVYNVARGEGVSLREVFGQLAAMLGTVAVPRPDAAHTRRVDIAWLVGDPGKLVGATGWRPTFSLEQTLRELVDAEAH